MRISDWSSDVCSSDVRIRLNGNDASATVVLRQETIHVFADGGLQVLRLHDAVAHAQDEGGGHAGGLTAPMPGKIITISVKAAEAVNGGDALLVMEAMHMEPTDRQDRRLNSSP